MKGFTTLIAILFLFLTSCGGDSPSGSGGSVPPIGQQQVTVQPTSGPATLRILPLLKQGKGKVDATYLFYYAGDNLMGTPDPNLPPQQQIPPVGNIGGTIVNAVQSVTLATSEPDKLKVVPITGGTLTMDQVYDLQKNYGTAANIPLLQALVNNAYVVKVLPTTWKAGSYVLNFLFSSSDGSSNQIQEPLSVQ